MTTAIEMPEQLLEDGREAAAALADRASGLTPAEQKAQGSRCACRGSDDYCGCQNVPDAKTIRARLLSENNH